MHHGAVWTAAVPERLFGVSVGADRAAVVVPLPRDGS